MDYLELHIFILSGFYSSIAIYNWYRLIVCTSHLYKGYAIKFVLGLLPVISFAIMLYTLRTLASFDVVGSLIYIIFYILLGFVWVFVGMKLVFRFFDLSWIDDALLNKNKAALFVITGAFLGLVVIYSGANVGDGPGWWCVLFAGGLGITSWFIVSLLMNKSAQVSERITVERDIYCGIRFGSYLLASGLILGRASAGDWTSFSMTIIEFLAGWPVLLLTLLAVQVEHYYINDARRLGFIGGNYLLSSICWGFIYILIALLIIGIFPYFNISVFGSIFARLLGVDL